MAAISNCNPVTAWSYFNVRKLCAVSERVPVPLTRPHCAMKLINQRTENRVRLTIPHANGAFAAATDEPVAQNRAPSTKSSYIFQLQSAYAEHVFTGGGGGGFLPIGVFRGIVTGFRRVELEVWKYQQRWEHEKRVAAACNDCGNIFKLRSLYNNGTSDCSIKVSDRL
jgi:hypothetical protein